MTMVAVVNDDTVFLQLMAELISDRGWEAEVFKEADGAYEQLRIKQPDLIIMDIRMGNQESGWKVVELLKLDPKTRTIPIIICSAATNDISQREDWLNDRGIDVLPKPFDIDDLYRHIDEVLLDADSRARTT